MKDSYSSRATFAVGSSSSSCIRDALGAPPPKPCQRFANGICLLNKKGKKCSSSIWLYMGEYPVFWPAREACCPHKGQRGEYFAGPWQSSA
eukprot:scaffold14246_cov105-Isochrysis_galbana.AAC.16